MIFFKQYGFLVKLAYIMFSLSFYNLSLADHDRSLHFSQLELKQLLRDKINYITALAKQPQIVAFVEQKNTHTVNLKELIKIDKQWQKYNGIPDFKTKLLNNEISQYFKQLIDRSSSIYTEAFLTNKSGVNIALFPLTSDYLQSDEVKWKHAFNNGSGAIYITDISYDESTETNSLQICVPVLKNNQAIGVLIVGIKLTYLQTKVLQGGL